MKTKSIYVGADVHAKVTALEAQTESGEVFSKALVPTNVEALSAYLRGMPGEVHLTFEEGTQAEWLHQRLSPLVSRLVVCDPRKNNTHGGNKTDRVDAHNLCDWLRAGSLAPVYHGGGSLQTLKQHVFSRERLVQDSVRTKNRLQAIYRSRGRQAAESGSLYALAHRDSWLVHLEDLPGEQARARRLFQQLDMLDELIEDAMGDILEVARKHKAWRLIKTVPGIGNVRAAEILAKVVTPHRFRTKRQFWQYCGFGVIHRRSDEYDEFGGYIRKRPGRVGQTRGLNRNHSPLLKRAFKGAANRAGGGVFECFIEKRTAEGMRKQMALLTLARKLAAITLAIWKKGEHFDKTKALVSR